jgi:hypothetical protein
MPVHRFMWNVEFCQAKLFFFGQKILFFFRPSLSMPLLEVVSHPGAKMKMMVISNIRIWTPDTHPCLSMKHIVLERLQTKAVSKKIWGWKHDLSEFHQQNTKKLIYDGIFSNSFWRWKLGFHMIWSRRKTLTAWANPWSSTWIPSWNRLSSIAKNIRSRRRGPRLPWYWANGVVI